MAARSYESFDVVCIQDASGHHIGHCGVSFKILSFGSLLHAERFSVAHSRSLVMDKQILIGQRTQSLGKATMSVD